MLSIVTINYNNIEGLRRTIDSVISQTWREFEWIIVDGGSTDGSKELIQQIAKNSKSNISWWCSEPDKGIYNAMNKGIIHSEGNYLNFMNSGDCYNDAETLSKVFSNREYGNLDVLYGDCVEYVDQFTQSIRKAPKTMTLDFYVNRGYINHQSSFIKRSLFDKEIYDESYKLCADGNFFFRRIIEGCSFHYIGFPICKFQIGGASSAWTSVSETERYIQQNLSEYYLFKDAKCLVSLYWKKAGYRYLISLFVQVLYYLDKMFGQIHFRK